MVWARRLRARFGSGHWTATFSSYRFRWDHSQVTWKDRTPSCKGFAFYCWCLKQTNKQEGKRKKKPKNKKTKTTKPEKTSPKKETPFQTSLKLFWKILVNPVIMALFCTSLWMAAAWVAKLLNIRGFNHELRGCSSLPLIQENKLNQNALLQAAELGNLQMFHVNISSTLLWCFNTPVVFYFILSSYFVK